MPRRSWLAAIGLLLCTSIICHAENWPQFRGPSLDGVPVETRLPTTWGPEDHIAWKIDIAGQAWSQPIVWNDLIFVTTAIPETPPAEAGPYAERKPDNDAAAADESKKEKSGNQDGDKPDEKKTDEKGGDKSGEKGPRRGRLPGGGFGGELPDTVYRWKVMCLKRSNGEMIWEQLAHEGKPTLPIHRTNTYASETPVTDGERVYAYFAMTGLYCYDMQGKLLWSKNLGSFPMALGWGTGSSPVLDDTRLYIQCDNEKQSFLVAFDKKTGDELWRVARDEKSSWSTPYLWHNKTRTELVCAGSRKMRGYDPTTGKQLWESGNSKGRCSATPVGTDELLYLGVGGGPGGLGPLLAIRAGHDGDITLPDKATTSDAIAWSVLRGGPPMASPLVYRDCLYVLDQGGGIVYCYDANDGKQHYRKRIEGAKGFTSSPWGYDGVVYCLDEQGQTFKLAVGPEFNVLGSNQLDDRFWSSVAVAGDHLLLRGANRLYCIAP